MNLDFSGQPLFSWYVVLLFISGIAMLVIGAINSSGLSKGWRVFNVLFGLGFGGYAFYLAFVFQGGSYIIFFKAFILPVAMIVNFFRSMAARRKAQQAVPSAQYLGQQPADAPYGQPNPYAQPAQPSFDAPQGEQRIG